MYSKRKGTPASEMEDQVDDEVKRSLKTADAITGWYCGKK